MPTKQESTIAKPADAKKTRASKPRATASSASKAKSKAATPAKKAVKKAAKKKVATRRRSSAAASASKSTRKAPMTPRKRPAKAATAAKAKPKTNKAAIDPVPVPMLPVSPQEPAAADASSGALTPAAPVPDFVDNHRSWAGAPIAATVAFMATLGALLLGYWTGYEVGSEAMGDRSATVAAAAEKTPTEAPAAEAEGEQVLAAPGLEPTQAPADPMPAAPVEQVAEPQPAAEPEPAAQPRHEPLEIAAAPADGLHLQVSALRNERAATALQRLLESKGFPVRVEAPAADNLVRVYVGPLENADDAAALAAELRKGGLRPFPKRL